MKNISYSLELVQLDGLNNILKDYLSQNPRKRTNPFIEKEKYELIKKYRSSQL